MLRTPHDPIRHPQPSKMVNFGTREPVLVANTVPVLVVLTYIILRHKLGIANSEIVEHCLTNHVTPTEPTVLCSTPGAQCSFDSVSALRQACSAQHQQKKLIIFFHVLLLQEPPPKLIFSQWGHGQQICQSGPPLRALIPISA